MNQDKSLIVINSADLQDGGNGIRFALPDLGEFVTGFVVRFKGKPYAYINQCAHVSVELDWNHGEFFSAQKDFLVCATHGAHYRPDNGFCVMGPCRGRRLKPIEVLERDGKVMINIASIGK